MKKLHGTYSIQPLTITDSVISEDAYIQESKLNLDYSTSQLFNYCQDVNSGLSQHIDTHHNPHGSTLSQDILQVETIKTASSSTEQIISVENDGGGKATLDIAGDIHARNAQFSENLNVNGHSVINGTTHISGNVVIDGSLSIGGETTSVSSNVIDYDQIKITPSTLTNRTAFLISPDNTGAEDWDAEYDSYLGNLLEVQKREGGLNVPAIIVDHEGNVLLFEGSLSVKTTVLDSVGEVLTISDLVSAPGISSGDEGFTYRSTSASTEGTAIVCIDSTNIPFFSVDKLGNIWGAQSISLGDSAEIEWDAEKEAIVSNENMTIFQSIFTVEDSPIKLSTEGKTDWQIFNRNSTVSFYYGVENAPKVEFAEDYVQIAQQNTSVQNLTVNGTTSFQDNVTIALNKTIDGVDIGIHNHSGEAGQGERIPVTSVIGLQEFLDGHMETVQDYVGAMVSSNTEKGISVTYDDASGKLNFDVADFKITAANNVSGNVTITNLGNATFNMTVLDSDKVDGLHVTSGSRNNEANKVVKTDASGYLQTGWINTTSGNAGTNTIDRVFASYDGYLRYYTPANFATQILALGGTVKNSHTHTAVNGLTPQRGHSTFNGTSGRSVSLSPAMSNTTYSVSITPTANPNGNLGEVWVIKSADKFVVYNSGTATTAFDWVILG